MTWLVAAIAAGFIIIPTGIMHRSLTSLAIGMTPQQ